MCPFCPVCSEYRVSRVVKQLFAFLLIRSVTFVHGQTQQVKEGPRLDNCDNFVTNLAF